MQHSRVFSKEESLDRLRRNGCEFTTCDPDADLVERRHIPTDTVRTYCEGHAPAVDGETWGEADGE